jgi:hypothetical protein
MSDENLYSFLSKRERELTAQISALKAQIEETRGFLAQRERELAEVRQIRASQTLAGAAYAEFQKTAGLAPTNSNATVNQLAPIDLTRYEHMTIKELVVKALVDHFKNGATTIDIRDFIQDAYGRDILPSSLRPQLHRLKAEGVLGQDPSTDTWNFQDGKRRQYSMYDHPSSRRAMKELQDGEPTLRQAIEAATESERRKEK